MYHYMMVMGRPYFHDINKVIFIIIEELYNSSNLYASMVVYMI